MKISDNNNTKQKSHTSIWRQCYKLCVFWPVLGQLENLCDRYKNQCKFDYSIVN